MPRIVPIIKPTSALVPETEVASQIRLVFFVNCSNIFDGAAKKYGFKSKTLTALSHSNKNTTPNDSGTIIFLMRASIFIDPLTLELHSLTHARLACHATPRALQ